MNRDHQLINPDRSRMRFRFLVLAPPKINRGHIRPFYILQTRSIDICARKISPWFIIDSTVPRFYETISEFLVFIVSLFISIGRDGKFSRNNS